MGSLGGRRRAVGAWLSLGCVTALAGALAAAGEGRSSAASAGSPERGRTVYALRNCGGCHDASPVGDEQPAGPKLELAALTRNAAARGKTLGAYVVESIVAPRAYGVPGYPSGTMPSYAQLAKSDLDDLVSFVIGRPFTSTAPARIPRDPVAACEASTSCRRLVAKWQQKERLPATALPGAKIVAATDCRSCHTYAGSGARSSSAPDLTRQAARGRTLAWLVAKLRCPECAKPASGMPSYAALGDANLRRVAVFLRASRGVRG